MQMQSHMMMQQMQMRDQIMQQQRMRDQMLQNRGGFGR